MAKYKTNGDKDKYKPISRKKVKTGPGKYDYIVRTKEKTEGYRDKSPGRKTPFEEAFAKARREGKETFEWEGETKTTKLAKKPTIRIKDEAPIKPIKTRPVESKYTPKKKVPVKPVKDTPPPPSEPTKETSKKLPKAKKLVVKKSGKKKWGTKKIKCNPNTGRCN